MKENTKKILIYLLVAILPVIFVAGMGALFANLGMAWFKGLKTPTAWVSEIIFPIIWTIIYSIFAVYIYVSLKNKNMNLKLSILLILNGLLNILWCLIFFTLNSLLGGLIIIILNLIVGFLLLGEIYKNDKLFYYLIFIYPFWLSLATCLNLAVWVLN